MLQAAACSASAAAGLLLPTGHHHLASSLNVCLLAKVCSSGACAVCYEDDESCTVIETLSCAADTYAAANLLGRTALDL
jgi:hypothetical protein